VIAITILACVLLTNGKCEILHGMKTPNQNLLVISIVLATCIMVFIHKFLFPLYDTMPKKKGVKFLGDFEQSLCTTNLKPVRVPLFWKHHCPKDGIVTVAQGGRLGNQMWEYASAWAVARRTGLEPYVPRCIRKVLDEVFEDLSIPPLGYVSHCPAKWDTFVRSPDFWSNTNQSILLPRFAVLPDLVLTWADDIRHEFRFKRRLVEASQRVLETANHLLNSTALVYVGIHVRRTDYRDYLWRTRGMLLAGEDFFIEAMNYFRKKFSGNVAFLVVSDDPGWCQRNLLKSYSDVFVVSKGGVTSPGQDLAVMAACNHSIIDYGTFGVWGAILASGETILYNITRHSSIRVSELLPNWHIRN